MTSHAQKTAARFLPSLTDVAFLVPLIFQFKQLGGAPGMLEDGDTGWHLRTGEWILAHGQVPQQDMFSYTRPGQSWFAWEWLWDVTFGFLHQHFGMAGVVAVSMLLICLTSAMLYRLVLRKCPNPFIAIVVTILADAGASIHWLARPHIFTMFFSVIFLSILDRVYVSLQSNERGCRRVSRLLWVLPFLMVLWTNLHGGFVAGLLIIAAYAGGGLLSAVLEPNGEARRETLGRAKPFFVCGALCTLATVANPYFLALHTHIVKYLADPYLYEHITEFMAFNFSHPAAKYIEPLMGLAAGAVCWNLYRRRFEYAILLAGWLHLGLHIRRNVPLFCIVCAPFVAEAVFMWLREMESCRVAEWMKSAARKFEASASEIAVTDRLPRFYLASAAGMAVLVAVLFAPQPPKVFQSAYNRKNFPVEAAKVLERDGDDRIFTSDIWGGYLIYRLYPKAKVYIDGRSDFYGADFELKYLDVVDAKYDWDQNLARYGARTALVPADSALGTALKGNPRWRLVYDDKTAIIFRLAGGSEPAKQVSKCPNQGTGESCGKPLAATSSTDVRDLLGSVPSKTQHRSGDAPAKASTT
jgi:hypothetical protein